MLGALPNLPDQYFFRDIDRIQDYRKNNNIIEKMGDRGSGPHPNPHHPSVGWRGSGGGARAPPEPALAGKPKAPNITLLSSGNIFYACCKQIKKLKVFIGLVL